jgi:hypothetical protein
MKSTMSDVRQLAQENQKILDEVSSTSFLLRLPLIHSRRHSRSSREKSQRTPRSDLSTGPIDGLVNPLGLRILTFENERTTWVLSSLRLGRAMHSCAPSLENMSCRLGYWGVRRYVPVSSSSKYELMEDV